MRPTRGIHLLVIVALVLIFVVTAVLYGQLPDPMPIHWNAAGVPDDFASRPFGAFLLPSTALAVYLLFLLLPRIDPRRDNYERFAGAYRVLRDAITLFLVLLQGLILYALILGDSRLSTDFVLAGLAFLFMVMGGYMPRFRSNWFVGIRTPWTLSDDRVWRRTHRLGGRIFLLTGVIMLAGLLLPPGWDFVLVMTSALVAALVPTVYSYLLYRRLEREGSETGGQGAV